MNDLVIKTTFKNNLRLLSPFYNFYKDVWNPKFFVFLIGYTNTEEEELKKINQILSVTFTLKKKLGNRHNSVRNLNWYQYDNIHLFLYNTELKYPTPCYFDNFRKFLFNFTYRLLNIKCKRNLCVDSDDFHYVKNVNKVLNQNWVNFHSLEYLPNITMTSDEDFKFISSRYFFRRKGAFKQNICEHKNNHEMCSGIQGWKIDSVAVHGHGGRGSKDQCLEFDKKYKDGETFVNLDNLDMICFSFGCLDLDFLLNQKHWLATKMDHNKKMSHMFDKEHIKQEFFQNYSLTENEKNNSIILVVNDLKKYFL